MKKILIALVLGACATSAHAAGINLLSNGDFGLPDIGITNFVTLFPSAPSGFEWEIMPESSNMPVTQIGTFWAAPAGGPLNSRGINQSVQIARTSSMWQSFATTPGAEYELSFYYSHNPFGPPSSQIVTVAGDSVLFENTFFHDAANTTGSMMWALGTATFVADSSLTTLTFAGPQSTAFNNFALDSVSVVATVVPVPAAVWLFGSALGLLGRLRRNQFSSIPR